MIPQCRPAIGRVRVLVLIVGGAILLFGIAFAIQVFVFYRAVSTGNQDMLSTFQFTDKFSAGKKASSTETAASVQNLFTSDDPQTGMPNAPLQVVEFGDFECSYTKEESSIIREIAVQHPDLVHFQFRDFPIVDLHEHAQLAAEAGKCAAAQGRFWEYHDKLFASQDKLELADLKEYATQTGLDTARFDSCLEKSEKLPAVQEDLDAGVAAGVTGTPTFFVNGVKIEGAVSADAWQEIISQYSKK